MSATARREVVLRRLLQAGVLASTSCSEALRRFVLPLVHGGVLAWQKSGGGQRLVVLNKSALAEFLANQFPHSENEMIGLPPRVQAVGRFRNTKRLRGTGEEIVCVRGWRDGLLRQYGLDVSVARPTAEHGLFSFLLQPQQSYELTGEIATVENFTVFRHFESLGTGISLAVYTKGRLSKQVLCWLASQVSNELQIVHVGDYDPTGLDEYRRLRQACKNVSLFLWPNLPQLFETYGNRALLRRPKAQAVLHRLRKIDDSPLQTVLCHIEKTGSCLEHEGLLIEKLQCS